MARVGFGVFGGPKFPKMFLNFPISLILFAPRFFALGAEIGPKNGGTGGQTR